MPATKSEAHVPADEPIIEISRLLSAPRELVWEALTDPKHLTHWWGPNGFSITIHSHDAREGGKWDFVMHGPDGTDYDNLIAYSEVVRPERLVYTHGTPGDADQFHGRITLAAEGAMTRITLLVRFPNLAARDRAGGEVGAVEGGMQTLGRLAAYLDQQRQ